MLKTLIDNLAQEGELTQCEKVLGDLSRVYRVADFWDTNADLMQLIASYKMITYIKNGGHTQEQIDAYIAGLGDMGTFMGKCAEERKVIESRTAESSSTEDSQ